jgi:hypothetical protein
MRWDNVGVSCCTAAVKKFVQRTMTLRKPLFRLGRETEASPQRLEFIHLCGEIAHQLFTLEKGVDAHAKVTRVAVRNRSVQMTDAFPMFAKLTSVRSAFAVLGFAGAVLCGLAAPTLASAQIPYLQMNSVEPKYAAIVIDANSGEMLYDKRADSPRYPASVTKVMTLYLTFEALSEGRLKLTDRVPITSRAAAQAPTKLGLPVGDSVSVDEAIRAMTVKSANDVAVAMAERLGGSESRFAALMTLRGQELGMRNSRFVNASGLPDSRQISTARDLAILSRATMRDFPQYYSYFSIKGFEFRGRYIAGHNRLLTNMPGFDGLKTGYTNASGYNLAGSAVKRRSPPDRRGPGRLVHRLARQQHGRPADHGLRCAQAPLARRAHDHRRQPVRRRTDRPDHAPLVRGRRRRPGRPEDRADRQSPSRPPR